MTRDIVQFVPMRKFRDGGNSLVRCLLQHFISTWTPTLSPFQAKETLAEIPEQFLSFMKSSSIKPNPPPLRKQQTSMFHRQQPPQGTGALRIISEIHVMFSLRAQSRPTSHNHGFHRAFDENVHFTCTARVLHLSRPEVWAVPPSIR